MRRLFRAWSREGVSCCRVASEGSAAAQAAASGSAVAASGGDRGASAGLAAAGCQILPWSDEEITAAEAEEAAEAAVDEAYFTAVAGGGGSSEASDGVYPVGPELLALKGSVDALLGPLAAKAAAGLARDDHRRAISGSDGSDSDSGGNGVRCAGPRAFAWIAASRAQGHDYMQPPDARSLFGEV